MKTELIERKVRVFISSIVNSKYIPVRKALKYLLEETNMVQAYAFEVSCASSQRVVRSYLDELEESDLCIFIIDNEDGCTDPVFTEYTRAKELQKPSIFIFCNETNKAWTKIQEEITKALEQKWKEVQLFSDIPYVAYQSAMNDIVRVYRRHGKPTSPIDSTTVIVQEEPTFAAISTDTSSLLTLKYNFEGFEKLKNEFQQIFIGRWNEKITEFSSFDDLCTQFFMQVICNKQMTKDLFVNLSNEIKALHSEKFSVLLDHRISAISEYFKGDLQKCFDNLKLALDEAKNNPAIPNWMLLDILIDCRNIHQTFMSSQNKWVYDSEWQQEITKNSETLHYPVIDRLCENHYEKNLEFLMQQKTDSPYTSHIGGLDALFLSNMQAFIVSVSNASLTQILCTRDRLIDSLSAFCSIYTEHGAFINLAKLLLIGQEEKRIKKEIEAFGFSQHIGSVNEKDVKKLLDAVNVIPIAYKRTLSKLILIEHFGYYMSDDDHKKLSDELLELSFEWLSDDNKLILLAEHLFSFLRSNARRINNEEIVEFVTFVLDHGWARWIRESTKMLSYVNFAQVPEKKTKALVDTYINLSLKSEQGFVQESSSIQQGLMILAKSSPDLQSMINEAIKTQYPKYYDTDYSLEFSSDSESQYKHIERYIQEAFNRNLTQGKNGTYSGFANDSCNTILNILKVDSPTLVINQANKIACAARDTILTPTQTYSAKVAAIELMLYLLNHYVSKEVIKTCCEAVILESDIHGEQGVPLFDKTSVATFAFASMMLKVRLEKANLTELLGTIAAYNNQTGYEIIKSLKTMFFFVDGCDFSMFNSDVLLTILQYAITMSSRDEADARYYSNQILLEFVRSSYSDIALECLSHMMDTESSGIKVAIVKQIKKLDYFDSDFKDFILQKARVDNHYLVRLEAVR